jgi:hypothetical protein
MSDPAVRTAKARVAALARWGGSGERFESAQADLAVENIAQYVRRTVEAAPPLTDAQKARLTAVFSAGPGAA